MPIKLSVIIPVYCVEQTLERCLRSVVGQTLRELEIIVVDDGSPDGSPALCDAWATRDGRINVIHQPNGGLSAARNAGLDAARGEWVTFVDSDDFLDTSTYAQVLSQAEESCDIVEFPLMWHQGSAEQELRTAVERDYDSAADYWLNGHAYEHTYACNKIYRRRLFEAVRFPQGIVFEDAWTLPLLLLEARRIRCCNLGRYYYSLNPQGITARANGRQLGILLQAHLTTMARWVDDRYYMHVVNIQIDVCRLTGEPPILPRRHICIGSAGLTARQRLKALALNTVGIKKLCNIYRLRHKRAETGLSSASY